MVRRDYHNHTLEQAMRDADALIDGIRMSGNTEDCEFIVGHGVIRDILMANLRSYGFVPSAQLGNSGVIVCTIE